MTETGIDCAVYPAIPTIQVLLPYLEPYWREQIATRGIDGLDLSAFPINAPDNARPDWRRPGEKPGQNLNHLRKDALDAFGSTIAICHCLYGAPALFNRHFAAALCTAINDWMAAEWLDPEPRLRASILIAPQHIEASVAEIERRAQDRRFVQVLMYASGDASLGNPVYWPLYEAAQRHNLPIGVHAGSLMRHATTSNGWPSFHLEDVAVRPQAVQGALLNMIHEGVFSKFPRLTVVMIEAGFTWLPNFLWRASKTWRGVRAEVPWVDRPPAEIIRKHVRFTLQPGDAPPDPDSMARILDQIAADHMLLFSTGYPHWHFDGNDPIPQGVSEHRRRRMLLDNPLATYPSLNEVMA